MDLKTSAVVILALIISTTASALTTPLNASEAKAFSKELVQALTNPESNTNSRLLAGALNEVQNDQDLTLTDLNVERDNDSAIHFIEWSYMAIIDGVKEGLLISAEVLRKPGVGGPSSYVFNFRSERLLQIKPFPGVSQGTKKGF